MTFRHILSRMVLIAAVIALLMSIYAYAGNDVLMATGFSLNSEESSPADRIKEEQIRISDSSVTIKIENAVIGKFEGTKSMIPLIDKGANAILIRPDDESEINIGDIIAYYSEEAQGLVTHRVVKSGFGAEEWYVIAKGDNTDVLDPEKIRFDQVRYVVVGILY